MASSLSHLINNFGEGIRKIKCKNEQNNIKCETLGIKYKHCNFFLEYTRFKNDSTGCKSLRINKIYQKTFDENLKKQFVNRHKFSDHDINKFIVGKRCLPIQIYR